MVKVVKLEDLWKYAKTVCVSIRNSPLHWKGNGKDVLLHLNSNSRLTANFYMLFGE